MQASLLAVQQTRHLQRHLPGQWATRSLLLVHPTTSSTLPHDSKTEASLQTIGLLEVLGSHKILSTGSDPRLAFPGPYRPRVQVLASSGAWRPEGRGDGQQTQRSCTKHMATRWSREKGSTEVEKRISTNRKFTSVHMCRARPALVGQRGQGQAQSSARSAPSNPGPRACQGAHCPVKLHPGTAGTYPTTHS